jgi:hypothetical protein
MISTKEGLVRSPGHSHSFLLDLSSPAVEDPGFGVVGWQDHHDLRAARLIRILG